MNVIAGIKGSLVIDDTYNSSPRALDSAIKVIDKMTVSPGSRKIAVLGDMLELGKQSEDLHREAGRKIAASSFDALYCVGSEAKFIYEAAKAEGIKDDSLFIFENSEVAGDRLQERINPNDLIFVKGSQGVRMEKAVKKIMAEPEKAKELLVRQTNAWLNR